MSTTRPQFTRALARLQAARADRLHDSCQIVPITEATDALGQPIRTAGAPGPTVTCTFHSLSAEEQLHAASWAAGGTARIRLPLGTGLTLADQLLYAGVVYEVKGIRPASADDTALTVSVSRSHP